MVNHQTKDGHPTDFEFGTYTFLTKLTPGDNCHGWSPTIPRMVTHQKDVYYRLGLALRLNSQN